MWFEITGPLKRFAGVSGSVPLRKGSVILNLQALPASGGGGITGIPDGIGGSIAITLPDGSNGFNLDPKHVGIVLTADTTITFSGTATYYMEVMSKGGFP